MYAMLIASEGLRGTLIFMVFGIIMAEKEKPIAEALQFKQEGSEPANTNKKIVELHARPSFLRRQKKGTEKFNEDALLERMKSSARVLDVRHQRSWNNVREISGSVLSDTEEGKQNFHELRTPRASLNSQRACINQLRGRLHAAIRNGELAASDDIVPWHLGTDEQTDEYRKCLALLQGNESRTLIKKYTPLLRQLEQMPSQEALQKFLDSLDERTRAFINLIKQIRQIEYDRMLFEQLFDEKKNPAFLKSFHEREQGIEKKKTKPSKEKRERAAQREKSRTETLPGAQMSIVIEYKGATITFERTQAGLTLLRIRDPKRILPEQERGKLLGTTFSHDLRDAPEWLRAIAREKGF